MTTRAGHTVTHLWKKLKEKSPPGAMPGFPLALDVEEGRVSPWCPHGLCPGMALPRHRSPARDNLLFEQEAEKRLFVLVSEWARVQLSLRPELGLTRDPSLPACE